MVVVAPALLLAVRGDMLLLKLSGMIMQCYESTRTRSSRVRRREVLQGRIHTIDFGFNFDPRAVSKVKKVRASRGTKRPSVSSHDC